MENFREMEKDMENWNWFFAQFLYRGCADYGKVAFTWALLRAEKSSMKT
jgi:hypothetical protein